MPAKVLVVVDMQNDFITGPLGSHDAEAIVPAVKQKIIEYRSAGYPVYVTKDTHFEHYLETEEGKHLPIEHCVLNTWGAQIVDELQPVLAKNTDAYPNSHVMTFNKFTFGSDLLLQFLKNSDPKISEIELCGVCTDVCVLSNAIIAKTALPSAHIIIDAECCAGTTPKAHLDALQLLQSSLQVEIKNFTV